MAATTRNLPTCFLMTFGHCGIDYLHSLLDAHEQIVLLPAFSFYRSWKMIGCDAATSAAEMFDIWEEYLRNHEASQVVRRRFFYDDAEAGRFYPKFRELLDSDGVGHVEVFYALHDAYCFARGVDLSQKKILIAHEHHPFVFENILADFPGTKILQINRDPRASLSGSFHQLTKAFGHLPDYYFNFNIEIWLEAIDHWNRYKSALGPSRYKVVLNEDLHARLETEMRGVAEWLGIGYSPVLLRCTFSGAEWTGESAYMTQDDKYPQPVEEFYLPENVRKRWLAVLTKKDIAVIEYLTRGLMEEFGFDCFTPKNRLWRLYALGLYLLPQRGLWAHWRKTYPDVAEFENVANRLAGTAAGKAWRICPTPLKLAVIFLRSAALRVKIRFFPGNRRRRYV